MSALNSTVAKSSSQFRLRMSSEIWSTFILHESALLSHTIVHLPRLLACFETAIPARRIHERGRWAARSCLREVGLRFPFSRLLRPTCVNSPAPRTRTFASFPRVPILCRWSGLQGLRTERTTIKCPLLRSLYVTTDSLLLSFI